MGRHTWPVRPLPDGRGDVWRQMMAGDPDFYALWKNDVPITISFPPIVDEDEQLTKETIEMLKDRDIISDETALELSRNTRAWRPEPWTLRARPVRSSGPSACRARATSSGGCSPTSTPTST